MSARHRENCIACGRLVKMHGGPTYRDHAPDCTLAKAWRETHERERIASYAPELRDMVKRLVSHCSVLEKLTGLTDSEVLGEARALLERVGE